MIRTAAQALLIVLAVLFIGAELAESEAISPTTAALQQ